MEQYEIQVVGHLDERRARSLGCSQLRLLPGGQSALIFTAVDQAALYGLLGRLRDAGLELVAAERTASVIDEIPRRMGGKS
jgi:SRSO17 transposase